MRISRHHIGRRLCSLLIAPIVIASGASVVTAGTAAASPITVLASTTGGYVVTLNTAFTPGGALSATARANQMALIASAQVDLAVSVTRSGGEVERRYAHLPAMAIRVGRATAQSLARDPRVRQIVPDRLNKLNDSVPDPSTFRPASRVAPRTVGPVGASQVGAPQPRATLGTSTTVIQSDLANNVGADGQGETIAILDTGVDEVHPFLTGRIVSEACFARNSDGSGGCPNGATTQTGAGAGHYCDMGQPGCFHGTHVAGIAAGANGNDGTNTFNGVAPKANIMPIRVFHTDNGSAAPLASDSDVIAGLDYVYGLSATRRIASANLSLGSGDYTGTCDSVNSAMTTAMANLVSVGITPVTSAGNDGNTTQVDFPACISSALAVAASDVSDVIASFTQSGAKIEAVAPGVSIESSTPPPTGGFISGYVQASGTSMAAPHVAGAVALLHQFVPGASVNWIRTSLRTSGVNLTDTRPGGFGGLRRIAVYKTLRDHAIGGDDDEVGATSFSGSGTFSACSTATIGLPDNPRFFMKVTGEANHAGNRGGASAWFTVTPTLDGRVSFDTFGSSYDTLLAAYDVTNAGNLVAANDDASGTPQSAITFGTKAGHTYHIALDGYRGPNSAVAAKGACVLHFAVVATRPTNDNVANATMLLGASGRSVGSNFQATTETGEISEPLALPAHTVWWKWHPPADGPVTVSLVGSDFATRLVGYSGASTATSPAGLTRLYYDDWSISTTGFAPTSSGRSVISFYAFAFENYFFQVDGLSGAIGNITMSYAQNPPSNDDSAGAVALTGNTGTITGSTIGATPGPDDMWDSCPSSYAKGICDSVWFSYTPSESGVLSVNITDAVSGPTFDPVLAIFQTYTCCLNIATNDNYYPLTELPGINGFPVQAGTTYWIEVDTAITHLPNLPAFDGTFLLQWALNPPPNDSLFTPTAIAGPSGQVTADTTRASGEPSEGYTVVGNPPLETVWWTWIAPADGPVTFSTYASGFDTGLAAWGGNIGGLYRVASDDNSGPDGVSSQITFTATAGTQYMISVDGMGGARGAAVLSWLQGSPTLTVADATVAKPGAGSTTADFVATLDVAAAAPVTVNYATVDGTAVAPGDYTAATGTLTFLPGQTNQTLSITVPGGVPTVPGAVSFSLSFSAPSGLVVGTASATGTILEGPLLSVSNPTVTRPTALTANAVFTVSLDRAAPVATAVKFATHPGTALAGMDYTTRNGTVTIPAGASSATVVIKVLANPAATDVRTFTLSTQAPAWVGVVAGAGTATVGPLTLAVSTSRATAIANGKQVAKISILATDVLGVPVVGATIVLTAVPAAGVVIKPLSAKTDATGTAHFSVTSTVAFTVLLTATATTKWTGTGSTTVTFV